MSHESNIPSALSAIDWKGIPWSAPGPLVRVKEFPIAGQLLRIVEFLPGFAEENWCVRAHIGFVVAGDLEIASPSGTTSVSAGDSLHIPAGVEHRVTRVVQPTRLFLVEETAVSQAEEN